MPKIFEPYYSTKRTGSGLGLATSHSIVKNHGGYIAIDSQVGRGTTVDVSLPAAVGHEIEEASPPLEAERGGTGRVLVLDDEAQIRNLATQLLQLLGYDAETVSSGGAAIERYTHAREQGRPFDLVMLDLTIPGGMGGGEVIRVLSQIDPDVKAVVVSGYANNTIMANYRDYGFKAVVTKPFTLPELRSALHDVAK
jgi:CheY-like chemotaxis protein